MTTISIPSLTVSLLTAVISLATVGGGAYYVGYQVGEPNLLSALPVDIGFDVSDELLQRVIATRAACEDALEAATMPAATIVQISQADLACDVYDLAFKDYQAQRAFNDSLAPSDEG